MTQAAAPLHIGDGVIRTADGLETLWRVVRDVEGQYALPYLQSARDLPVRGAPAGALTLEAADGTMHRPEADGPDAAVFRDLPAGEYALTVDAADGARRIGRIGIGTVIAALGDSITEGYHGRAWRRDPAELHAGLFPPDAVSRDGRNFPQFAPTAHRHKPAVNCFESWMTALNDRLAERLGGPVFLANEGWGGITTGQYLERMRTDANWRARLRDLRPDLWLVHLGVNDIRQGVAPADAARRLGAIVDELVRVHGAYRERILVATPSWDCHPDATPGLGTLADAIRTWTGGRGPAPGPDFHAAYATDRARWYGADPVHPNEAGMARMAALWCEAIVAALAPCPAGEGDAR